MIRLSLILVCGKGASECCLGLELYSSSKRGTFRHRLKGNLLDSGIKA